MPSYGRGSMLDFIQGDGVPITPEMEEEERRRRQMIEMGLNPDEPPPPVNFEDSPTALETRLGRLPEGMLPDEVSQNFLTPLHRRNIADYYEGQKEPEGIGVLEKLLKERREGLDLGKMVESNKPLQMPKPGADILETLGYALSTVLPGASPQVFLPAARGLGDIAKRLPLAAVSDIVDMPSSGAVNQFRAPLARRPSSIAEMMQEAMSPTGTMDTVREGTGRTSANPASRFGLQSFLHQDFSQPEGYRGDFSTPDPADLDTPRPDFSRPESYRPDFNRPEFDPGEGVYFDPRRQDVLDAEKPVIEPSMIEALLERLGTGTRSLLAEETGAVTPRPAPKLRPQDKPYAAAWEAMSPEEQAEVAAQSGLVSAHRLPGQKWLSMSHLEEDKLRETMRARAQAVVDENNKALALEAERAAAGQPPTEVPPVATSRPRESEILQRAKSEKLRLNEMINELPPIAEGHTRLYRGENADGTGLGADKGKTPDETVGRWFASDIDTAFNYVKMLAGGRIRYIDVPTDTLPQIKAPSKAPNEFLPTQEVLARDSKVFLEVEPIDPPTPRTRRARAQAQAAAQSTTPLEPQVADPDAVTAQALWDGYPENRTSIIDNPALFDTPWETLPKGDKDHVIGLIRAKRAELDMVEPSAAELKALEESGDVPPVETPPVAEPPRRGRIDGEPIEAARPSTVTTHNQKIAQLWQNILSMPEDQLKAEMFQVKEKRALDNLKGARALREGEIRELRAAINNEYAFRRSEAEEASLDPRIEGGEGAAVNRLAQTITVEASTPRGRIAPREVPADADYAKVPVPPRTAEPGTTKVTISGENDEWVQGLDKFFDDAYKQGVDPKSKASKNIQLVLSSNGVSAADAKKMTWEQAHERLRAINRTDVETPNVETPPIAAADGAGGKPPRPPKKTATPAEPDGDAPTPKDAEAQGEAGLPPKGDEPIDLPKSEYIEYSDKPAWGPYPLGTLKKLFPDLNIKSNTVGNRVRIEIRDKKGTLLQKKTIGRGQKGRMAEAAQELMDILEKENGLKALITPETKMQRISKPEPAPERLLKKKVDPAHPYNRMSQEELADLMAERNIPERKTGRMSWTQRRDALEAYDANKAAGKATDDIAAKGPDTSTPKTEEEVEKILEADIKASTGLDPEDVRQLPNMNAQKGKVHLENRYKDSDLSFRIQRTPGSHWKASAYKGKGKTQTLEKQGWGTSTVNEAIYDLESKIARTDNVGESSREYAVRNNIPEVITRLAATLRSTTLTSLKEGQDITRAAAKAGRFAEAAKSLKGKTGLDAYFGSLKYLKGELPTVKLDKLLLTKNESDLLSEYIKLRAVPTVDEALGDVLYSTYANANRALVKLLSGKLITTKETSYLTDFFGPDIKKAIESHDPAWKKTMRWVYETSNLPRFVVAAGDLSWPLRQGFPLIRNKEFWKGNADMMRAFFGGYKDMSEYADDVQAAIEAHPKFNIGHNLGLYLSQGDSDTDEFVKAALSRSWGLGRTNEAFRGVDNNVRWNMFYRIADQLEAAGVDFNTNKDQYQAVVNYLNFATGRGNIGNIQALNQFFSTVLFAPRFLVSRPELAWQTGKILRPGSKAHELIKKQVALDIGTSYGILTGLLGLAAVYHGQNPESEVSVETDPRSSDFAKLRVGTARVDLSGGWQPLFRFLAQASTGEVKSVGSGEVNETDSFETFERFLRSKLNIMPAQFLDNFKYGATFQGKELVTMGDRFEHLVRSTLLPMTLNQIAEIMGNSGLGSFWLVPIAELGGNTLDFTSDDERVPGYHEYRTADSVAADLVTKALFKDYNEQHEMAMVLVRQAQRANGDRRADPKDLPHHMEAEALFNRLVHRIREGAKNNNPELVSYLIATKKARKWEPSFTDKDEEKAPPPPRYIKPPEEIDGPWTAPFANQVLTELLGKEWGIISPNGKKPLAYNQLSTLSPEAKSSLDTFRAKLDEKTFEMSKGEFDSWAKLESNADRRKVWKAIPAPQLAEKSPEKKLKEKGTQLFKERPTDKLKIKESVDRVNPRFFDSFAGGLLKGAYDFGR